MLHVGESCPLTSPSDSSSERDGRMVINSKFLAAYLPFHLFSFIVLPSSFNNFSSFPSLLIPLPSHVPFSSFPPFFPCRPSSVFSSSQTRGSAKALTVLPEKSRLSRAGRGGEREIPRSSTRPFSTKQSTGGKQRRENLSCKSALQKVIL